MVFKIFKCEKKNKIEKNSENWVIASRILEN